MDVNLRLKQFCDWYSKEHNITQKEISKLLEVSPSQLSSIINGRDKVGLIVVEKFLNLDASINANWLISGKGTMFRDAILNDLSKKDDQVKETRPRITLDAAAGALSVAENGVYLEECEQLPLIESLPKYDFTIFARGDSMSPEYESGDELACLFIRESQFIQSGRVHVLDTVQGIVVKIVYNEGEYFLCSSLNQRYRDFRIHKSEVYNVALVVGLIRRY